MLESYLVLAITLFLIIIILIMISTKLGISAPILLVVAGLVISMLPGVPPIRLRHELLFIILLPPLLFRAAWNTCWKDFWANKRPIALHGFGLVIVTAGVIGLVAHLLIPNFSLAMGFLLGSIVAPPDALAATSVLQQLKIPRRLLTILEGESLVNDAASLILFRFAVAAVLSGQFSFEQFGEELIIASLLGVGIGVGIAGMMSLVHRLLPTTPTIDTLISLITPYLMYLTAEKFEASGVLAVVSGGFLLAYHSQKILTSESRLHMMGVWETLVFVLNGLVFILVGLQLPLIVSQLAGISLVVAIGIGVIISLTAIAIRLMWVFPATYLPRILSRRLRMRDPYPDWQVVFLLGWCGMRGIVTLASALSMPFLLTDQSVFPFRALILFVSFTVIIFTLVVQGLTLPYLIRRLGVQVPDDTDKQEAELTTRLAQAALQHLLSRYQRESTTLVPFMQQRRAYERLMRRRNSAELAPETLVDDASLLRYQQIKTEIIAVRRKELTRLRSQNLFNDALIRQKEFELDLEQLSVRKPLPDRH